MVGRALLAVLVMAAVAAGAACSNGTGDAGTPSAAPSTTAQEPEAPPTSDVLTRALRTDLCALLDEAEVARLGWRFGTAQAQTLTACAAGSADHTGAGSVTLSVDTAVSENAGPADGNRCTRLRIVDQTTMIALKVQVRADPDPCAAAEPFLATAVRRFEAGAGAVEPPHPWIALDACALLPRSLPAAAPELGAPKATLREVRRLGPRGCIATLERGEVTLSVEPTGGRVEDLDGDEVAIAARPARQREFGDTCLVRLIGGQLGEPGRQQVQVITVEVHSEKVQRCSTATAMAAVLVETL